jgi:hypothetical protein
MRSMACSHAHILFPRLLFVAVTAIACASARPVSQSPVRGGPSRVFTAGYGDVRPLAALAVLSCPLVMRHARALRDTTYELSDSASQIVVMDTSLGRAELVRLTIAGSSSGPTTVSVRDAASGPAADTLSDECSRRIFAAIDHYLVAEHEGDSTTLAADPVEIGPTPNTFTVFGGIPAQGPRNELAIALPPQYQVDLVRNHHSTRNGFAVYGPDSIEVVFHAFVLANDSSRRELHPNGYAFGSKKRGPEMRFSERVTATPFARIRGVEISASATIHVDHIVWWTGDPSKRIVWP